MDFRLVWQYQANYETKIVNFFFYFKRFYQSGEMVVVAKKMIRKGEEITNNYGIHHNNLVCQTP